MSPMRAERTNDVVLEYFHRSDERLPRPEFVRRRHEINRSAKLEMVETRRIVIPSTTIQDLLAQAGGAYLSEYDPETGRLSDFLRAGPLKSGKVYRFGGQMPDAELLSSYLDLAQPFLARQDSP